MVMADDGCLRQLAASLAARRIQEERDNARVVGSHQQGVPVLQGTVDEPFRRIYPHIFL